MLDMWVIFVNISPVIGPVIHEERQTPACAEVQVEDLVTHAASDTRAIPRGRD
jgi:hypothetical protein